MIINVFLNSFFRLVVKLLLLLFFNFLLTQVESFLNFNFFKQLFFFYIFYFFPSLLLLLLFNYIFLQQTFFYFLYSFLLPQVSGLTTFVWFLSFWGFCCCWFPTTFFSLTHLLARSLHFNYSPPKKVQITSTHTNRQTQTNERTTIKKDTQKYPLI